MGCAREVRLHRVSRANSRRFFTLALTARVVPEVREMGTQLAVKGVPVARKGVHSWG